MREHRADLVVSVRLKTDENLSIYVLTEHKSQPDRDLTAQLLKYQTHLYVQQKAAAVLPIVVYHGQRKNWPNWRDFVQSRNLPNRFAEDFAEMLVSFGVAIVNLRDQSYRDQFDQIDLDVGLGFRLMADIWEANEKHLQS